MTLPLACLFSAACLSISLTVATGTARADAPAQVDVMFVFDSTSSMSGAISAAQAEIQTAMTQLDADLADVNYGVAEVRDYPRLYGAAHDKPWKLDQAITSDRTVVQNAINGLTAAGGGDNPEAYARGVWETETNPLVGWRPGSRHVIVLVGDDVPHDNDLNQGIPLADQSTPSPFNTGIDPGPDGVVGTADDLDWQAVLNQLLLDGTPLEAVYVGSQPYLSYWQDWAVLTGGKATGSNANQLATDIAALAEQGATTPLPPCPDGSPRNADGTCPLPPCPDGQPRDRMGNCPVAPCPNGKPPDSQGHCPLPPAAKPVSIAGLHKAAHLLTLSRLGNVPFDFDLDGAVTVNGQLSAGGKHAVSSDPAHVVSFSDASGAQRVSFDLPGNQWSGPDGSRRPSSLTVTLGWPHVSAGVLPVPVFDLIGGSDYTSAFAKLGLDAAVHGSLTTSVGRVASWLRRSAWLPAKVRADSVAWLIANDSSDITRAYGTPLLTSSLVPPVRRFLGQAPSLARQLGIALPRVAVPGVGKTAFLAGKSRMRTLPRWFSAAPTAPAASSVPGDLLPIGLRAQLEVGRLSARLLRHGAWRRLSGAQATAAAVATLAEPLPYRAESLWTSKRRVVRGGTVAVLAGRLSRRGQAAVELIDGGHAAEAPIRIRRGIAGGVVTLPLNLPTGSATLAIVDFSKLRRGNSYGVVALGRIIVR